MTGALNELEPEDGNNSVADIQKWKVCVEAANNDADRMTALYSVMNESQYQKVEIAYDLGVNPGAYVEFMEIKPKFDADGNGSYKQAEIKAAIDSMTGCSTAEKAVLWQLSVNSNTKATRHPYSKKVGQQVIDARAAAKAAAEKVGSSSTFEDAITSQW